MRSAHHLRRAAPGGVSGDDPSPRQGRQPPKLHLSLRRCPCRRRGDGVLKVVYAGQRVGNLASGFRPDQNVTALRSRGLELVVLDQQPGELALHLDQAAGARLSIGRGRKGTHGAG